MPFTVVYYFPVFLPAYFQCLFDQFHSFTSLHYNRLISVSAGLRHGPTVARLLELRVRILPWHGCVSVANVVNVVCYNNNNNYYYLVQLGCNPVAVVMLHVYKT